MTKIRAKIGIIGFGNRGRSHYKNLVTNFDRRAEVVAVADLSLADGTIGGFSGIRCFRDYQNLLALAKVDAIIIATPEAAHVNACIAAMEAGKAVLLEKAVAPAWTEAVRLYRYVRSSSVPFMLALNLRLFPASRALKEILEQKTIGRVVAVTCRVNAGSHWGADCFRRIYHDRSLCGDLVLSKLTHDTDLVHHLLQTRATNVMGSVAKTTFIPKEGAGSDCDHCAITAECTEYVDLSNPELCVKSDEMVARGGAPANICPFTRPSTSHDTAAFLGSYANGAVFSFVFTTAGPVYERQYLFNGTEGQISSTLHGPAGPQVMIHRTNEKPEEWIIPEVEGGHDGADPMLMESFLDYLDSGSRMPVEPQSILTSVMVPLGGMESSVSGQGVDLTRWYRDVVDI